MPPERAFGRTPEAAVPQRDVYTVSRLNSEARTALESAFPRLIWVQGELSNLARPSSGHIYFSIKDSGAQVRCAMFRQHKVRLAIDPEDGMQVLLRARVGLYEGRGEFQLIVEHMEPYGEGALQLAFEQLKHRLAAEGLFDEARKRPLPAFPHRIGVVTSPTGAALHDVLSVLQRRFPAIPVVVYPVPVQGEGAAERIAAMLRLAGARRDCDVLLLTRGGGSLEDLWTFNEEAVARAVFESPLPVIVGVGHEIDFTIADFVADQRAPTPSAAAELISPDGAAWLSRIERLGNRLSEQTDSRIRQAAQRLAWLDKRLTQQHPERRLAQQRQRVDELEQRLLRAHGGILRLDAGRLSTLHARLHRHVPSHMIHQLQLMTQSLRQRAAIAVQVQLERQRQRVIGIGRALDGVSPLATLGRGYALVRRLPDAALIRQAAQVKPGDQIEARVAQGRFICAVEETYPD